MPQKKKLQVFVSSTYEDLKGERQAAVEAILNAGHIPAGMELFAAGDEGQMAVIRRWIDESDVFVLILGGRYGSLEPKSKKSYTQLEYEYALEQGKPLFAVVIEPSHLEAKVKELGPSMFEQDNQTKFNKFRSLITSKMVRFWSDPKDIKLAIHETLPELLRDRNFVGWVPGTEAVDTAPLAAEIARLGKENADLRERLERAPKPTETYNRLTFEELYKLLLQIELPDGFAGGPYRNGIYYISKGFGDEERGLIHLLWCWKDILQLGKKFSRDTNAYAMALELEACSLVNIHPLEGEARFTLNEVGKQFLLRLRTERDVNSVEQHVLKTLPD